MVENACMSCPRAATERRYRCRMKPYHAAERASSSQPGAPDAGLSRNTTTAAAHDAVTRQASASQAAVRLNGGRTRMSAHKDCIHDGAAAVQDNQGGGIDSSIAAGSSAVGHGLPHVSGRALGPTDDEHVPRPVSGAPSRNRMTRTVASRITSIEQHAAILHVIQVVGELFPRILDRRAIRIIHLRPTRSDPV